MGCLFVKKGVILFTKANSRWIQSINKTYKITKDQLAQIKQFLYIYETYYGNGTMVPKTSWFASTGTEVTEAEEISETVKEPSMVERLKTLLEVAKNDTEKLALEKAIAMLSCSVIKKAV
mgnify:CR=1 FL=1